MKEYYFPKCLLPIHERPILFEIINYWIDSIDEVVIVLNRDSGEMIKEYVTKYFDKKIDIKYCYQEKKSGTFFAIKKANGMFFPSAFMQSVISNLFFRRKIDIRVKIDSVCAELLDFKLVETALALCRTLKLLFHTHSRFVIEPE